MGALLDLRSEAQRHMVRLPSLPGARAAARATWHGRMVNEFASHIVFEGLASQMAAAGFDREAVEACAEFAREEKRHGVLCGAVVESLGGSATAELPEMPSFPRHEDVSPREGVLRNLLSISCMSETVAVALIGAERLEMPEGELHALLTRIWADEIGHARFGWALLGRELPSLDAAARARLDAYTAVAFAHVEAHELAHLPEGMAPPPEGAVLGVCNGSDARVLFYETIEEVIIPGLTAMGLSARAAWQSRGAARAA